uniref:TraR/DksA family transcriptional regulator n=1 Tax=Yoonia sp. TaxID=2212373 RepID=UPI004048DFAE|tara:strand:+ start:17259 stop:17588 length:330 start_codon:yes stop_codon:yes gene_type:complete
MKDTTAYKHQIETRIAELKSRLAAVNAALDEPTSADLNDQSIELEDDEVLESVGRAGLQELVQLEQALGRIAIGTYGVCQKCGEDISAARLTAVPFALLCRDCANPPKN